MNNASVIQMINAKLAKSLIITKVQTTANTFDLTSDGLVSLAQNKVPEAIVSAMLASIAGQKTTGPAELLTNESVIRMVQGQVPRKLMIAKIRSTNSAFDVSSAGLVKLDLNKVPEEVIKAMMVAGVSRPPGGL